MKVGNTVPDVGKKCMVAVGGNVVDVGCNLKLDLARCVLCWSSVRRFSAGRVFPTVSLILSDLGTLIVIVHVCNLWVDNLEIWAAEFHDG